MMRLQNKTLNHRAVWALLGVLLCSTSWAETKSQTPQTLSAQATSDDDLTLSERESNQQQIQSENELELSPADDVVSEIPVEAVQQFVNIYQLVKQNFVRDVSDDTLFEHAMKGLVALDPYSRYLPAKEYQDLIKYTEGDLATVDFDLRYVPVQQVWEIQNLSPDSDASKSGLKNGMIVRKIEQKSTQGLNQDEINQLLTGQIGSSVAIQLGEKTQAISLVRTKKVNVDVQAKLLANQVLWIKVPVFKQETANEIKRILQSVEQDGIQGVLLDLRSNPGGLLSSAVETADLFLNQGLIVSTQSRAEGNQSFRALSGHSFPYKLGILINGKSASAAEVLTAALQQHQRAYVMGEKSYGKGVVQKILPLDNGDAVSLTVAHYYTPDGQQLDGKGIEPNLLYPFLDVPEQDYLNRTAELLLQAPQQNK
ncbi:MAG: S41 family peptidase [Acinetobacter sp.]|nr:S41 family peptidase [Acinetobacter sp.]